jgi:dolichol-phosphate mannosyltransferase
MNRPAANESLAESSRTPPSSRLRRARSASAAGIRDSSHVFVILPSYNEEQNLEALLRRIQRTLDPFDRLYEVVVVNDGSTDRTADIARQMSESMPIQLINHAQNQGLGGTLRTGFLAVLKHAEPNDIVVTMDADNTQPPESIPQMVARIDDGYDLIVASRFQPGARVAGVPWSRRLLSDGARWFFSALHPIQGIRDYTCGFRAYRAGVLQRGIEDHGDRFVSEPGFSCMADVLLKLRRQKLVAGEIPLDLRYDQKGGASKMKVLKTVGATIWLAARRRVGL